MRVLSLTHGPLVRAELFADVTTDEGHELEEWSVVDAPHPPRPLDEYDAVLTFGGAMNVDQEREHPWLVDEDAMIRKLVADGVPLFGVCLGSQLLAKAAGGKVGPLPAPENGFVDVELTPAARDDIVFSQLPERFAALNLHRYAFEVPESAVELASSTVCTQALRVGECAWGVQFHPEVRREQVEAWLAQDPERMPASERERVRRELADGIDAWSDFGAELCRSFLAAAERLTPARYSSR
jgi:GMP synthase-like glutamine amidotransferase